MRSQARLQAAARSRRCRRTRCGSVAIGGPPATGEAQTGADGEGEDRGRQAGPEGREVQALRQGRGKEAADVLQGLLAAQLADSEGQKLADELVPLL